MIDLNKLSVFGRTDNFSLAKAYLITTNPFYAILSQQCGEIKDENVKTITIKGDNGTLYIAYAPSWFNSLKIEEGAEALKHVLSHLILGHVDNSRFFDEVRIEVAQDLAVNSHLNKEHLPKGFLHPDDFNLPLGKSTMEYYALLPENVKKPENSDNHKQMKSDTSGVKLQKQIRNMVQTANNKSGKKGAGNFSGGAAICLSNLLKQPELHWTVILKRYLARAFNVYKKTTWKRPNKRFGEYIKGYKKIQHMDVFIGMDESGSIDNTDWVSLMSEIEGIYKTGLSDITLCKFTGEVEKIIKYTGINDEVSSRFNGGTLFQPVFDEAENYNPDLLIMFTDGFNFDGKCTYSKPQNVLWVLTSNGKLSSKFDNFGDVIKIKKQEDYFDQDLTW